ncbi:MAG: nucleotidyltransferase domain-containing protein [Nanoarchaeota archaeon]
MKKEESVLELFFNEPTKHWHFEGILKSAKISRPQAVQWIKKFMQEGLVQRLKPRGKMPYYTGNYEHPSYRTKKRIYTLNQLYKIGFITHLMTLPKAKSVILFGSFARADWHSESDIDLFVYGNPEGLNQSKYERLLHREIQLFNAQSPEDLKKMGIPLLLNILKGQTIKGTPDFLAVKIHA